MSEYEWRRTYEDGDLIKAENLTLKKYMELLEQVPLENRLNDEIPENLRWTILVKMSSELKEVKEELQRILELTEGDFQDDVVWDKFNRARWHFKNHLLEPFQKQVKYLKEGVRR